MLYDSFPRAPKTTISLRITPATLAAVQAIAQQDNRSTSYTVERLLIAAIAQTLPKPAPKAAAKSPALRNPRRTVRT